VASKPTKVKAKPTTLGSRLSQDVKRILTTWKSDLLKMEDEGSNSQWTASQLLKAADRYGMFVKDVVDSHRIMHQYGLRKKDITPEVLGIAAAMDRRHFEGVQSACGIINRMGCLIKHQTAWGKSGLPTFSEYLESIQPPKVEAPKSEPSSAPTSDPSPASGRSVQKIYGFPVTAVIRWMGTEGWTREQAAKVLSAYEVEVSPATIAIQLKAGKIKDTSRGEPASLTDDQANLIYEKI